MLGLTNTVGYAVLALRCLARTTDRFVLVPEVAACASIPRPYLAKVLGALARAGILETKRGYRGGCRLARLPRDVNLVDVARAVEGPEWLAGCLLGKPVCATFRCCPTARFWARERRRIEAELQRWTLERLSRRTAHGAPGCSCAAPGSTLPPSPVKGRTSRAAGAPRNRPGRSRSGEPGRGG